MPYLLRQTSVTTHVRFEIREHHQSPRISHQSRLAGDVPFGLVSVVTVRRYVSPFRLMGGLERLAVVPVSVFFCASKPHLYMCVCLPLSHSLLSQHLSPAVHIQLSLRVNAHPCFNQTQGCFLLPSPRTNSSSSNTLCKSDETGDSSPAVE